MAPRGAPSPGRRRPPISPTPSPACPAWLRRGALRRVRRTRGPAWRLLAIAPASLCPAVHRTIGNRSSVSAKRAGQGLGRTRSHPWLRERAPRSRELLPPGLLVWLPTATTSVSSRSLRSSFRKASGRSAAARRPGVGPSAASGERVQRGRPRAGERRGEGEGKGKGGGGQWLGTEPPAPLHHPRPPLPKHSPHRPRPRAPPHPRGVACRNHSLSGWSAAPPHPRFGWGSSHPNSPWLLPKLHRRRRPLSLHPSCPAALSADPSP